MKRKTYKGRVYTFAKERGMFKVSSQSLCVYWFQKTQSVREAKKRFESFFSKF